jgi:hypothetical protein
MRELDLKIGSPSPQCSTPHLMENMPSSSASGGSKANGEKTRIGSPNCGGVPGGKGTWGCEYKINESTSVEIDWKSDKARKGGREGVSPGVEKEVAKAAAEAKEEAAFDD